MSVELYLAFALAVIIIVSVPGPTVLVVVGHAATHGRRAVLPLVGGVVLADMTLMTCSLLGIGLLLQTFPPLAALVKAAGALYLILLGCKFWQTAPLAPSGKPSGEDRGDNPENRTNPIAIESNTNPQQRTSGWTLLKSSYVTTALNPKAIVFFTSFLPQFVRNDGQSVVLQLFILAVIFVVLASLNIGAYALLASNLGRLMQVPHIQFWCSRCAGVVLLLAGIGSLASLTLQHT